MSLIIVGVYFLVMLVFFIATTISQHFFIKKVFKEWKMTVDKWKDTLSLLERSVGIIKDLEEENELLKAVISQKINKARRGVMTIDR